ncbi:MAG: nitroreductase/quinone reductase family protein [Halanaeroarchaeum sp.]
MADTGAESLPQLAERYLANPLLRILLRSPLHGLASDSLLLLSYEGRRSGDRFRTPVAYERDGDELVVTTFREAGTWWRNFQDGHPATLWLRGDSVGARGRAITGEDVVAEWLATLADRDARILSLFDAPENPDEDDLAAIAGDLVVVRFTLDEDG